MQVKPIKISFNSLIKKARENSIQTNHISELVEEFKIALI